MTTFKLLTMTMLTATMTLLTTMQIMTMKILTMTMLKGIKLMITMLTYSSVTSGQKARDGVCVCVFASLCLCLIVCVSVRRNCTLPYCNYLFRTVSEDIVRM